METPTKMDDLGVPLFSEASIYNHLFHPYISPFTFTVACLPFAHLPWSIQMNFAHAFRIAASMATVHHTHRFAGDLVRGAPLDVYNLGEKMVGKWWQKAELLSHAK